MVYGREPRFPLELATGSAEYQGVGGFATIAEELEHRFKTAYELAKRNQALANFKMVVRGDKEKHAPVYKVGAKVWLYVAPRTDKKNGIHKKLKYPWQGLYIVIRQKTPNILEVKLTAGNHIKQSVHVNRVKPFHEQRPAAAPELDWEDEFNFKQEKAINQTKLGEDEAMPDEEERVMKITAYRVKKGGFLEYNVRWIGGDTTWEPQENVEKCEALDKFLNSRQHEPLFGLLIQLKWLEALFIKSKFNYNTAKEKLEVAFKEYFIESEDLEKLITDVRALYSIAEVREFMANWVADFKKKTRPELERRGISRVSKKKSEEEKAQENEEPKGEEEDGIFSDEEEEDKMREMEADEIWITEELKDLKGVNWKDRDWIFEYEETGGQMKKRKLG